MSSLWTPGGEHNVPRDPEPAVGAPTGLEPEMEDAIAASLPDGITLDDLSPEQLAQAEEAIREMAAVREQVLSAPAGDVIANHAMGLFELGALHLSQQTPNFAEAGLAIDAMAALVDGLGDRLGEAVPTLQEGLQQLRMTFVQLKQQADARAEPLALTYSVTSATPTTVTTAPTMSGRVNVRGTSASPKRIEVERSVATFAASARV